MKLCLVVPTRNRAALAMQAVTSVGAGPDCALTVVLSDNSDAEEAAALEAFCRRTGDAALHYMRPPAIMALPAHWDWALEQALALTDATHFAIQYDRKVWMPGKLAELRRISGAEPETLVAYGSDVALPSGPSIVCARMAGTGKLYEVATDRVIQLTARGLIAEMGQSFPVLSNCVVPRLLLERIRSEFGDICDSSTPDAAFTFRFCALESRFRYWDCAAAVVHSFRYSNGRSLFSGLPGGTWDDFRQLWGDRPFIPAAPIPELNLGLNVCFHEYNLVRSARLGERFPAIELPGYLRQLAHALPLIEDAALAAAMRARLEAHGWREDVPAPRPLHRRLAERLRLLGPGRSAAPAASPAPPPPTFATDAEAVAYLFESPPHVASHNPLIDLMEAGEIVGAD